MKAIKIIQLLLFLTLVETSWANYDSWKRNPDGTYVCGGAYDSFKVNPDGTYVCGGAHDSFKVNPDGTYAVGFKLGRW